MPNFKTYADGKNIYSVDMMLAYINTKGHPIEQFSIDMFVPQLEQKVWGEWSPKTVIEKMDVKKYHENSERIKKADLSYPIIITGNKTSVTRVHSIVDGYHRISRAYLEGKKNINAYVFDKSLMNKFILNKDMNFVKVHQNTGIHEILELWTKRFCTV
jgi:hypothetical protein